MLKKGIHQELPHKDPLELPELLRPAIEAAAEEMDECRALPEGLLTELRASGVFRLHTPRELGGFEAPSGTVMKVYEQLGRLDGSVAWVVANGNAGLLASRMQDSGVDRIWGSETDPVMVNSTGKPGKAVPVRGGYQVSGHYKVISGISAADWLWAAAATANDPSNVRFVALRRGQWTQQDTWSVSGMRGTGSHDVLVEDAFVPDELAVDLSLPPTIDRPIYRGLVRRFTMPAAAAVMLGVAQQAIDEIVRLAPTKKGATGTLAELPHTQFVLGKSEAALQAARLLLYSLLEDLEAAAERRAPVTLEQQAALRGAMSHAALVCREVLVAMYELGSSSSLYLGNALERLFRDGMAGLQHAVLSVTLLEAAGRVRLGLDPGVPL